MPANFRFPFALVPIAQLASAVLALTVGGFLFQSGSAGLGALAILWLMGGKGFRRADLWMAIAAFAFSIVGDYFLSNRGGDPLMFVYGIGFFFLAHLGYLGYALCHGRLDLKVTALFCTGYLIFFFTSLYGGISDPVLMWAALAYLFVSCFSMGAAWGISPAGNSRNLYLMGIGLILFSDTLIAFREFMAYTGWDFLILPTYYLAHLLVTWAVWEGVRPGPTGERRQPV